MPSNIGADTQGGQLVGGPIFNMVLLDFKVNTRSDHQMCPGPPPCRLWSAVHGAGQVSLRKTDMPPLQCAPPACQLPDWLWCQAGTPCQAGPSCLPMPADCCNLSYSLQGDHAPLLQRCLCNPGRGHAHGLTPLQAVIKHPSHALLQHMHPDDSPWAPVSLFGWVLHKHQMCFSRRATAVGIPRHASMQPSHPCTQSRRPSQHVLRNADQDRRLHTAWSSPMRVAPPCRPPQSTPSRRSHSRGSCPPGCQSP